MMMTLQIGYASMNSRFTIALNAARMTPTVRARMLPARIPTPAKTITAPRMRWVQPQAL